MLSALGAAVFAASAPPGIRGVLYLALGFIAASLPPHEAPGPAWVGGFAAIVGGVVLVRPGWQWLHAFGGGLAGVLALLIRAEGMPTVPSYLIAVAIPAVSFYFAGRNPGFAPRRLREDGLLLVFLYGVAVAAWPAVLAGWTSAMALNMNTGGGGPAAIPFWVILVSSGSLAVGGLWAMWRRN
jgi:hypothetical protein